MKKSTGELFEELVGVMQKLLSPEGGCPWDKGQTHNSLVRYLVEECYEVIEAIEKGDLEGLKEELGDLLLQIVFHSEIGRRDNEFSIDDVIESIKTKLIERHPHVFGKGEKLETPREVFEQWQKLKNKEVDEELDILDNLPSNLPALYQAYKVGEKVATLGFDWSDYRGVIDKVKEELEELERALNSASKELLTKIIEEEIGDILFTIVNLSRHLQVDPEEALRLTIKKFQERFAYVLERAKEKGGPKNCSLEELERFWQEGKEVVRKKKE